MRCSGGHGPRRGRRRLFQIPLLDVELVQHPVEDWREHDARRADQDQPGEKRIRRGEDLRRIRGQRVHRPHARENHGRIQQRIHPLQPADEMIPEDADAERTPDQPARQRQCPQEAVVKGTLRARLRPCGWFG